MILKLKNIFYLLADVNIDTILVSNKTFSVKKMYKYFIGYLHDGFKIKPLYIGLLETSACIKSYDGQTKWIYILIEDDDLL